MTLNPIETPTAADIALDVRALAFVLTHMHPDLSAPVLPGESWQEIRARRAAALDIADDLLAEAAALAEEQEVAPR
ncbi:hypothetical protein OIE66_30720 [Nonomuraea sp. NBC_01738]|uniref:hypothetical protein n=1 Tax=Nonomuraea sp. NBC_01738 TaxID=2976003 RepID=UPI002E152B15|nr:hypothetical protein OIE66_30720 [Nonomuraea sp. NBC_01738]